jgi:polysaccharide biosynthesis/export protein
MSTKRITTITLSMRGSCVTVRCLYFMMILALCLAGCGPDVKDIAPAVRFVPQSEQAIPYASDDILKAFESGLEQEYRIGPGDRVELLCPRHPNVSGDYVVGPEGNIAIYLAGEINLKGKSRNEAESLIKERLQPYYDLLAINLTIKDYRNNRVYVLGRVDHPGEIQFQEPPTLLRALAVAAPFPPTQAGAFLTKCAVIRGKNQILWVDLQELLDRGNLAYNVRLANNDVIYIPDALDSNVFVMGEVNRPGSVEIRQKLTVLEAIGFAGGLTENAVPEEVKLIRDRGIGGGVVTVDLYKMMEQADLSQNFLLKHNDILYVPKKGIAWFNYYLRQIDPAIQLLIVEESIRRNK